MNPHEPLAVLHLTSPVHVAIGDDVLHVRRMGLAMLTYLALEGPTRRERLADVIWGHRQGLRNLRVELHRLRASFASVGVTPLQPSVDPLALAPSLGVAPVTDIDEFLVGLEDISSEYQAWIEHRRDLVEHTPATSARDGLLDALAGAVRPPFVLVLQGLPGCGRRTLAQALAHRLHLPFAEGLDGDRIAVRYLPPDQHDTVGLAAGIRRDHRSVWVIGRSAYGVDSRLLLELRASIPPERLRFEALRPLTWREAQRGFLDGVAFHEGAALYLASSGHPAYLRELVTLHGATPAPATFPVPQRVRAALTLEAAHLSEPGQLALERLSVLGRRFSRALATAAKAEAALDELERTGWLRFEDDVWRFADPIVAKVFRVRVPPGQRGRLERLVDGASSTDGARQRGGARSHAHLHVSRRRQDPPDERASSRQGACPDMALPEWTRVIPGREVFLDDPLRRDEGVESDAGSIVWWRLASANGATGVAWPLPDGRLLARLAGRVAIGPAETGDTNHDPTVLRLTLRGTDAPAVRLAPVTTLSSADDASVWLPTGATFEHWFLLPPGTRALALTCHAASVVIEMDVTVHRVEEKEADPEGENAVMALDLGAATVATAEQTLHVYDSATS
jgi:hypothetical protein